MNNYSTQDGRNMTIIGFDQRDGYIWFNGEFVPWKEAKIHVLNHGLNYASSVFEGERVYNNVIFKSAEHTKRLRQSAHLLDFDLPFTDDEINQAKNQLVAKQQISNGYMKMMAWRGSEQMTIAAPNSKIHLMVALWSLPSYYKKDVIEQGIKMMTSQWVRPAPNVFPFASKAAGSYVVNTLAKHKAMKMGYDDALMLDYRGYIAEGASSNIFFVIDNQLHTPIADCFLNGITRQTVIELAKQNGIIVHERHIRPEELANASEAFLTGTASEITPVVEIDQYMFEIGEITRELSKKYKILVENWKN